MADPDVLGFPRNQVQLTDGSQMTAAEIAALPEEQRNAILVNAPPERQKEIYDAMVQGITDADYSRIDALVPERTPRPDTGVMAATQAQPANPQRGAPVAELTPEQLDQLGREAQARTEALMQTPTASSAPPAAAVSSGDPHTDYMRGVLGGQAEVPFNPREMMMLTEQQVEANRQQAAKPLEQQGAEAFPITAEDQPQGQAAGPAAATGEKSRLDQAIEAEQRFKDAIDAYMGIYKGWDGSPEKAPNPELKALAEAAIKASVERQAALAEQHGKEQEAVTQQIAEAQKQSADYSMEYSKAAEKAAVERDRKAQEYDAMIRKAQSDLDAESKNLDPHRMMRGGRGLLLALFSGLGAFGASYNRTPNWAGQFIDDALDKDFQAQKDRVNIRSGQMSKAMELYNMFRLRGMEDAAAKAAVHALVKDYYANRIASLATIKQGMIERQASQSVASSLREQAEIARNTAILESAAGTPGKVTDIVKLAQEAVQRGYNIEKTQAEIRKLEADAASAKEPKKGYTPADRSKHATEYADRLQTIKNIEEMIAMVKTGKVGPVGSRLALTADGHRFDVLRRTSLESLARSFGAATTDSDRKAASNIDQGWIPQVTPGMMLDRLNALLTSAKNRHSNVLAGQDPGMVEEIVRDYANFQNQVTQGTAQSTENYAKIAGGHL